MTQTMAEGVQGEALGNLKVRGSLDEEKEEEEENLGAHATMHLPSF